MLDINFSPTKEILPFNKSDFMAPLGFRKGCRPTKEMFMTHDVYSIHDVMMSDVDIEVTLHVTSRDDVL